ncbi:MAG: polysaccharide biosynthesis protein [Flavobacteriales bacterium]
MLKNLILKNLNNYASKWLVLLVDAVLVALAFVIAYLVRFNLSLNFRLSDLYTQLPVVVFVALLSCLIVGSYKGIIRHTGTKDAYNVFLSTTLMLGITAVLVVLDRLFGVYESFSIPISIVLIHYFLNTIILIASRFLFKTTYEVLSTRLKSLSNVLIYGAGDSGILTATALSKDRKYTIVGFVDNDANKIGKRIDGFKIFDASDIKDEFIEKHKVQEVIISIQSIESSKLLEITDLFLNYDIEVKMVPPISKWMEGNLEANQIKQVEIDDLLGRSQIVIDNPIVKKEVKDRVVLVTGAAGSIGGEITKQLARHELKQLVLVDQAESSLYDLQQELIQTGFTDFVALVADVRDKKRMSDIFEAYKPEKVFHAAAYKHVPLMEQSPYEAIKINICGTKTIADLAIQHQVDRFVMVSTDKAVNPTNVMGATKRAAELYISCLSNTKPHTKFTITRFGNVLGSNGSVIPLFKKQIENGGPLTLTHKDVTRFFMTIPEACSLVLEAGTMGVGGEIYIFDMGRAVKVFDLAKRMIALSGFRYPEDMDIKLTGLRPGEKLYEELLANNENTVKTYHEKIMIAKTAQPDTQTILDCVDCLCTNKEAFSDHQLVSKLKELVPEFISQNSIYDQLDTLKV